MPFREVCFSFTDFLSGIAAVMLLVGNSEHYGGRFFASIVLAKIRHFPVLNVSRNWPRDA